MSAMPTDVVKDFLQNTAPDKVQAAARRLVADDATYISLNFDNPELKKILPWTGTSKGQRPFIDTGTRVAGYWTIEEFNVTELFGAGENVAVFGSFRYRSVSLGKVVTSPFSIHAKGARRQDRLLPVHGRYVRVGPVVQQEGEVDDQDGS